MPLLYASGMWTIGRRPYLHAKPLIHEFEDELELAVLSQLSVRLRKGELNAALIPIVEYLENPIYQIVPGIAIGAKGPVRSVYLAHKNPIAQLKKIALDPASKTSNLLLQVALAEFFDLKIQYVSSNHGCDGELFIGDPALQNRKRLIDEGFHLLDLGDLWFEQTNLPFVFAFWAMRTDGPSPDDLMDKLERSKQTGLTNLDTIVQTQKIIPAAAAKDYLTRAISFDFGEKEELGLLKFQELCLRHGLISQKCNLNIAS